MRSDPSSTRQLDNTWMCSRIIRHILSVPICPAEVHLAGHCSINQTFPLILFCMIGGVVIGMWLLGFLGIPILAILSIREWATTCRATLPLWRSRIGIGSVGAIFCGWLFLAVLTVLGIINDSWMDFFTVSRNVGFLLLAVTASLSCLALKAGARVQAVAAGGLLVLIALLWLARDIP